MGNVIAGQSAELPVVATATSSHHDFDFLVGAHRVRHRKLKSRLTGSDEWIEFEGTHSQQLLLDGIGNLEQQYMPIPGSAAVHGIALRLFDPATRLWSIYWSDSTSGKLDKPVLGSFENGIGHFFTRDSFNGQPIIMQFRWDATHPDEFVWSQAFSVDDGKSWEWNWYMYFKKV